jgi:hypothetical protein
VDMHFKNICGVFVRLLLWLVRTLSIYLVSYIVMCLYSLYVLWFMMIMLIMYHRVLSHVSHLYRNPTKFLQMYMIKLSNLNLSVILFMSSLMNTSRGELTIYSCKTQYFISLLKILIGCHQSSKRERLKVHLGPLLGFGWVMTSN